MGVAFETVFLIIAILSAVTIGATVLVSQAIGAGDSERANQLARQAISWGVVLAIPLSVLGYVLAPQAIGIFHVEADVAANAIEYLQITSACSVAILLSYLCGAVLRGAGDSRTPLKAAVLANIVNVVLAYVLIFGHFGFPELGVGGSAWGAAAGRAVGAAYMLFMLYSGKRETFDSRARRLDPELADGSQPLQAWAASRVRTGRDAVRLHLAGGDRRFDRNRCPGGAADRVHRDVDRLSADDCVRHDRHRVRRSERGRQTDGRRDRRRPRSPASGR